jgi:peroxiredoxin
MVVGVIRSHFIIDEKGKLLDVQTKVTPDQSVQLVVSYLAGK